MTYLESKQNAWSEATKRTTAYQIAKYGHILTPDALWTELQHLAPYSRYTVFNRLASYHAYSGNRSFVEWMKCNGNFFKHSYQSKAVPISYEQAMERILTMPENERMRALSILKGALRWCESEQDADVIIGKGGKPRQRLSDHAEYYKSYHSFLRSLKKHVGVTPHALRKLALTRAARKGAQAQDLCAIAGWSSITTAIRYLQPETTDKLKEMLK